MSAQVDWLDPPKIVRVRASDYPTHEQAFRAFHAANLHVYENLVRLTRQAVQNGRRRIGIGMLFEVLRWNYVMSSSGSDFKLNNNYRSHYVRLIIKLHPEWAGMFELRELRAS